MLLYVWHITVCYLYPAYSDTASWLRTAIFSQPGLLDFSFCCCIMLLQESDAEIEQLKNSKKEKANQLQVRLCICYIKINLACAGSTIITIHNYVRWMFLIITHQRNKEITILLFSCPSKSWCHKALVV